MPICWSREIECASLKENKEDIMKNKFLLIAVVACAMFCMNCGEENKTEETEKTKVEKSKEDKVSLASESEVA